MSSRREFLGTIALPAAAAMAGTPLYPPLLNRSGADLAAELAAHPGTAAEVADDEDFWVEIQRAFTVDRSLINLNNVGSAPPRHGSRRP